jgi:hypothetical protein
MATQLYRVVWHVGMKDPYLGLEMLHVESLLASIVSPVSWEEEKVFVLSSYLILGSWI